MNQKSDNAASLIRPPVPLIVAVTGHRDLVTKEIPGLRTRVREFLVELSRQYPDLPLKLLCPLAEGADRVAAKEAMALDIPLIVPLPFERELYLDDFADDASRREFDELCEGAIVAELPRLPGCTRDDIAVPGHQRDLHYAQLGVFLSGHCQILLAVWDGKPAGRLGGTQQLVQYHHEGEMKGFTDGILDAQQILADSENDLVYHIACSRDRPDGSPAEGLEPLQASWFCADPDTPRQSTLPRRYDPVFRAMSEFNRDALRHASAIDSSSRGLAASMETWPPADRLQTIDRLFRLADWLANHFQKRVNTSLIVSYGLAILMGLAFVVYTDIPDQHSMLYAFLLFFAIGFALYVVAEKRAWHRKYLDYRGLAEGLRVQFYWSAAGVTAGERTKFAHDNFLQKQDVELGWIRNVMRYASMEADTRSPPDARRGLSLARQEWIGDPDDENSGQIHYYETQLATRARNHRRTERIGMSCLWAGIGVTVALAVLGGQISDGPRDTMILLMGILPLIAAVREAYANKTAEKELIKQYRFMHRIFQNARRRLQAAESPAEQRAILRALGDAALDEHAEWILMHRERPLEHSKL